MILLYITILCYVLHLIGAFKKIMYWARLDGQEVPTIYTGSPQGSDKKPPLERAKAESIAANILLYEGYHGDAFGKAKRMTDEEINALIARFKIDIYGF